MSRICVLALLAGLAICTSGFVAADSEQVARGHRLLDSEVEVRVGSPSGTMATFRGRLVSADSEWLEVVKSPDQRFWINRDHVLWITQAEAPMSGEGGPGAELRRSLLGAWVLVGKPGDVGEPQPGARMKFRGEKHWVITQADPETGHTIFHHGGTYTLDGDKYVETVTFANENTANLLGNEHLFTIKVEGDTYTQIGEGNSWNEVWKRLRK